MRAPQTKDQESASLRAEGLPGSGILRWNLKPQALPKPGGPLGLSLLSQSHSRGVGGKRQGNPYLSGSDPVLLLM